MRKVMLLALFVTLGLVLSTASFASGPKKATAVPKQEPNVVLRGTVTAVNAAANQITMLQDGAKDPVVVTSADAATVKVGQRVKITLKPGTANQAESVKIVMPKNKK